MDADSAENRIPVDPDWIVTRRTKKALVKESYTEKNGWTQWNVQILILKNDEFINYSD